MIVVDKGPQRLDMVIKEHYPKFSRNQLKTVIKTIKVNGMETDKLSKIIKAGDKIEIDFDNEILRKNSPSVHSEPVPLNIVYEDELIAVINKQQGVTIHHGNAINHGTIEDSLFFRIRKEDLEEMSKYRYGIVHRLDKDTSGLFVVAKTPYSAEYLITEFKKRRVYKKYIALAEGFVAKGSDTIETGIKRSEKNRTKYEVCDITEGKIAISEYEVQEYYSKLATFLSIVIKTGRTHQIRVHLRHMGNPVIGDSVYSKNKYKNFTLMLHAKTIGFNHPEKGYMEFDSEIPKRFELAKQYFLQQSESN